MSTHTLRTLRTAAVVVGLVPLAFALLLPASAHAGSPPTVTWNLYLGGRMSDGNATYDKPEGLITTRHGGTFVTGRTTAPLFPGASPAPAVPRAEDAFISYIDNTGRVVKTQLLGGPGNDVGRRVAVNPSIEDHLYIVGTTDSPTIRDNAPVVEAYRHHGGTDAFLARMQHNGTIDWFMYLGGPGNEEGNDLTVLRSQADDSISVYVAGKSDNEVWISRVDIPSYAPNNPSLTWSKTFGSAASDEAHAILISPEHRLYVGGVVGGPVSSPELPTPLNEFGGGTATDGFIAEVDRMTGKPSWFMYLGGNSDDDVRDILYQPVPRKVVVVGNTRSPSFPLKAPGDGQDIFLLQLNENSPIDSLQGPQLRVGKGGESMEGHATADNVGNIYVGGKTTSTTLALNAFDPQFQFDPTRPQENDGFVAMVDPELTGRVWRSYVGGPASAPEAVVGLSALSDQQLTFVGYSSAPTRSGLLLVDTHDDRSTAKGDEDGFVFRLAVDTSARPEPEWDVEAPLGWSCSSVSGGGSLSLLTLALLALRRARRRSAR